MAQIHRFGSDLALALNLSARVWSAALLYSIFFATKPIEGLDLHLSCVCSVCAYRAGSIRKPEKQRGSYRPARHGGHERCGARQREQHDLYD